MAELNITQQTIVTIKELTGLTWEQLAEVIGASSGDYVRKVASGAKPGLNLAANVTELMERGAVSAPVPRRVTASGKTAKVRAPKAAEGAASRTPSQQSVVTGENARRLFRLPNGKLGWQQTTGDPRHAEGAKEFNRLITSAGRGRHRVRLKVHVPVNGKMRWVDVGGRGGYTTEYIRKRVKSDGGVTQFLATQLEGREYGGAAIGDEIDDVEVIAE